MKKLKIGDLEIEIPIIQGGMGIGISLSGLASAVANEGGVGVISSAGLGLIYSKLSKSHLKASILGLKEEIKKAKEKTSGVIGVNVMVAMSNYADMVSTAIKEKVDIVFSGAGMPLDLPSFLTFNSKTKLVPIVSSARALKIICQKWKQNYDYLPDAIVVEGPQAGGHLGYKEDQIGNSDYSLESILGEIVVMARAIGEEHSKYIPVIAAGGIYSGDDIYKIMKLGADGVQMGSRFVTTTECDASYEFKKKYIDSTRDDIQIIKSPVGMPGRAISGSFITASLEGKTRPKKCPYKCIKTCDYKTSPYCIIKALYNAANGNFNEGYAFAGAKAYLAEKVVSVKDTFSTLKEEYFTESKKHNC